MRTIVISDIHGCYDELQELIMVLESNKEYNKDTDRLIFLGDYVDRGEDSRLVVKFIRELQKDNDNVIALMGNHEDMLVGYYNGTDMTWKYNGYNATLNSYRGFFEEFENDTEWMSQLPLYYEDDYFVYVHAGVDLTKSLDKQSKRILLWTREPFLWSTIKPDKKVVFGHTPSQMMIDNDKPYYTQTGNIGIDTGCVFGGRLTALIIDDDEVVGFWQTESRFTNSNEIETENNIIEGEYDYE